MIESSDENILKDSSYHADLSLRRLLPRIEESLDVEIAKRPQYHEFKVRLKKNWNPLFTILFQLYGDRYDFFYHLEQMLIAVANASIDRPDRLNALDHQRLNQPDWYLSQEMVGGALYVDLFSENLKEARKHISYFKELGLSYLHLMPLFAVRPGNNDGGYAISNYRSVDPRLGTVEDLQLLSQDLSEAGITLVLDFVFNHTSDDHLWAQRAQAGDKEYQDFYFMFDTFDTPKKYDDHLREIFPTVRRGNFSWHDGLQKWIWTTFNNFQWDLNYKNPAVFTAMLSELLFIANMGVDILRLDAVAFIWKEMGTNCENLPQAHQLIQAFNYFTRIAAPGVAFKSEAIVHPDEVLKYIDENECQLSYNPTLMALLWESLATRKTSLLVESLSHTFSLPENTTWVNYLRCHDDIGWTFDNQHAEAIGINAYDHRQFLNAFYTGQFPGSFARGVPFQENVSTGDMRISGTMASLAGLELGIEENDEEQIEFAIRRILLLHGINLSIGGIPLIYLGEEWGVLNDYDFVKDPAKAGDSRWIHRPKMEWKYLEDLKSRMNGGKGSIRKRIFQSLKSLISIRKDKPAFYGQEMALISTDNEHLLGYVRSHEGNRIIVLANFTEHSQSLDGNRLRTIGLGRYFKDLIGGKSYSTSKPLDLDPYQIVWLERE